MANRLIRKEEIVRGTIVRLATDANNPYSWCTIVMVRDGEVYLNRPYLYANKDYDTKLGMFGVEQFSVSEKRATQALFVDVDSKDIAQKMIL